MSVKIRVSYQEPAELDRVLQLLRPVMKGYNLSFAAKKSKKVPSA